MIIGIDPGRDMGWAILQQDSGCLTSCGLGENSLWAFASGVLDGATAYCELPQVYRAAMSKGDPNDLIKVAYGLGQITRALEDAGVDVVLVLPRSWKGTIHGDVMTRRILSHLTEGERDLFAGQMVQGKVPKGKHHNVIDAIGMAKWGREWGPR